MGYYDTTRYGYSDDYETQKLKEELERQRRDREDAEYELERERRTRRELEEATERRRRQRMSEIEEEQVGMDQTFQDLEQLRQEVAGLRKTLRNYEPPTLPTICEVCGKEYDQEVRYYDPGHDPRCDAEDRHAHPTSAGEICTVCRLQGAPP